MCAADGITNIADMDGIHDRRQAAEQFAIEVLSKLRARDAPSDSAVLSALRLWGFDKNKNRDNVLPEGHTWVHSDTFGIIEDRNFHDLRMSRASQGYKHFQRLLTKYVCGKLSVSSIPYTTIAINKGYAGRLHRDKNNSGPSVGIAVGPFSGGGLCVWPGDTKTSNVELVRDLPHIKLDLKHQAVVFDGTCAHEVHPYKGERYSLIFFTVRNFEKAGKDVRRELCAGGAAYSTERSLQKLREMMPESIKSRV
jgi:hypothetical protein